MCLALYLGAKNNLPLIPYQDNPNPNITPQELLKNSQRFHTAELKEHDEIVRIHFTVPKILYAGSYERCGCGFNHGREYPEYHYEEDELIAAKESVEDLVRYVRENNVKELYACWMGEESLPCESERSITIAELASQDFFFKQREIVRVSESNEDKQSDSNS